MIKPSKDMAIGIAGIAAVALVVLWVIKQQAKEAIDTAGGILSGNNQLTKGTPYEGAGVLGTLGAGFNAVSGGVLEHAGDVVGSWLWDITHKREATP